MSAEPVVVRLRDGLSVWIRETTDGGALIASMHARDSARGPTEESTNRSRRTGPSADRATTPRGRGFVCEYGGEVVARAAYRRTMRVSAEAWVAVVPRYRRKGIGGCLLRKLASSAVADGVRTFESTARAGDHWIVDYIQRSGFPIRTSVAPGSIRVTFPTSTTRTAVDEFKNGEVAATTASIERFFKPKSIAVIGASRDASSIGGELFENLIKGGFNGPVYPVNRTAPVVQSVAAYRSILDCPGDVDLAFVVVPAGYVLETAKECARKGVKALVVISSGFAETGEAGARLQEGLVSLCRESGMRMIGPNCMGVVNTDQSVRLNGQFAPFAAAPGTIGFWSQSGALGIAVIDLANKLGLGLAQFVSAGNRADVSGNDIIEYWERNDDVRLILLYIESFGNPRRFARLARRVTRKKPIIAVKSGRSAAGFRGTQSHTGAIVAASDVTVDALFRESGVIRTDSLEEMFDVAALLSTQPVPSGDRVAIITNAGGAGILAADACESLGLTVPELSARTQKMLRSFLLPIAGTRNPVDMSGAARPSDYASAVKAVAADEGVDSLMVIYIPPLAESAATVASEILKGARAMPRRVPVVSTFMAAKGVSGELSDGEVRIPAYPFPELAAQALASASRYGLWLKRPREEVPAFRVRRGEACATISRSIAGGDGWLDPQAVESILGAYGITVVPSATAGDSASAARAARTLGGRVALKGIADGLVHRSDEGAVMVGLTAQEVDQAARGMERRLVERGLRVKGFLVQKMVTGGVEMFLGVTHDATFGPLVACGAGGTLVELLKDVTVGVTPLTRQEAGRMVRSLRTFRLLDGYRGAPKADVAALEGCMLRLSQMVEEIPEIAELDLNPVMVLPSGEGVCVVDARIRVLSRDAGLADWGGTGGVGAGEEKSPVRGRKALPGLL